jgi:RNA polymerase sigma-70 factor (ECF subfamily)
MAGAPSDEELMTRYQRGDVGAFATLLERHRAPVYRFVRRTVGDEAGVAEDLTQETFIKVVRAAGEFERRSRFTTWLYRIARNLCLDALRRRKVRAGTTSLQAPIDGAGGDDGVPATLEDRVVDPGGGPDFDAMRHDIRDVVEAAVAALPVEQREVFVMREHAGVAFEEIAEITGAPLGTVKSRMRYALKALQAALVARGLTPEVLDAPAVHGRTMPG